MLEPINFGAALRRSWRLLVALAIVFAVVAALLPSGAKPAEKKAHGPSRWVTTSEVGVPPSGGELLDTVTPAQILYYAGTLGVKIAAVTQLANRRVPYTSVGTMTAASVHVAGTTKKSRKNTSTIVTLSSEAATPALSAELTNAYATALASRLAAEVDARGSNKKISGAASSTGLEIDYQAEPGLAREVHVKKKKASVTSSKKIRVLAGLVIGLLVGAAIVFIRELLDKRLRNASRAEAHFRYPVLAEIPNAIDHPEGRLVVASDPGSVSAEAYRKLRMAVLFKALAVNGPATNGVLGDPYALSELPTAVVAAEPYELPGAGARQVVLVVSAGSEETRPVVVANLAATYAEAAQQVIVIDTSDLDSGLTSGERVHHVESISPDEIRKQLQPSGTEYVSTLSLRPFVPTSGQLVSKVDVLVEDLRQLADVVIIEAPSLLGFHHGEALVHAVDVVLVVAERSITTIGEADQTGEVLRMLGSPVLGVVFTNVPPTKDDIRHRADFANGTQVIESPDFAPQAPDRFPAKTQA
jgi:polysaccharide biosynthesis transport protein